MTELTFSFELPVNLSARGPKMGWATPNDVAADVAKLKLHDEQQAA